MTQKKTTLKSMAKQLNVSTATISNAFNRPNQLSEALRERILKECELLGYTGPSITARSLRTGKTGIIGVLLADSLSYNFSDPVATEFLAGISQTLDEHHVNMLLLPTKIDNYKNTQVETIPDSFIVYGKPADSKVLSLIKCQHKPTVLVDFKEAELPSINVDNFHASYQIAKHAIQSKDDHVLVFALKLNAESAITLESLENLYNIDEAISRSRFDGYVKAMSEIGVSFDHSQVWQLHDLAPSITKHLIRGALTSSKKVDVLLCMSDKFAISALEVASELGLSVPNDLRIVGFDGIPQSQAHGLSTVEQPIKHKGEIAARMVLGELPNHSMTLDTKVIVRSSG